MDIVLNSVEVYSFADNTTVVVEPMNVKRPGHGCCSHADKIYVCGGENGGCSACCEILNPGKDQWEFVANMNKRRRNFQVVFCGSFILALWGTSYNVKIKKNESLNSIEYYDVRDN